MRSDQTGKSHKNTRGLRLVGEDESSYAWSPYGPKRAGLTTSQRIERDQALTESLKSLEKQVETLESRYYAALDTLIDVMDRLVRLGAFTKDTTITEEESK